MYLLNEVGVRTNKFKKTAFKSTLLSMDFTYEVKNENK
jgi:hypothetical protein